MYRKILVPLDCSPVDDAVLEHVAQLARIHQSEVILLRAVAETSGALRQDGAARIEEHLESARQKLAALAVKSATVVAKGDPVAAILQNAEALGCDLIAMATHGHGPFRDFLLGSVATSVRHATTIPVLLIRRPKK